mgnify:CR=1 FL=1
MKKILSIALVIISMTSYGQKFAVTPNGLKNAENNEKSYVVIEIEGMTAKQLFDNAVKYVNKNYKNPEEVIKGKTDGEYLKFDTYVPELLFIKNGGIKQFFSAKYTTKISFKDGKVKYEIIGLEMNHVENNMTLYFTGGGLDWMIYNKKGALKRPEAKTDIENYFNSEIDKIIESLQGKTEEDSW